MTAPSPPLISRYQVDILSLQPRDNATMLGVNTIELFSRIIYFSNRKRFPCLHSLIYTRGVGRIRDSYTKSRRSRGFENSPDASSVYIRIWKHRKNCLKFHSPNGS